ncbi:nuclear factor erythroid 2-related factor 3 [Chanos chanos]|uniref:Nuclear factor erythroid 2-related factor 3 n=1 Tax=Chanos chanos TaxID=29144 RepID=A0A6J2WJK3_CHACN|nr:endoplasmic reticulum membrane sensor NFE2L1-like [Chanos chanos]
MQYMKKYFTEGLIQFTIILSLIGARVDVDSYLNGYFSPLIETDGGPSSAFIQTPFHHLRDTADGYPVHPKCPELDYYFTSRRLLSEVRALGAPTRFHTRLNAWLVHLVQDGSEFRESQQDNGSEEVNSSADGTDSSNDSDGRCTPVQHDAQPHTATGPCNTTRERPLEAAPVNPSVEENAIQLKDEDEEEEISSAQLAHTSSAQLAHSSTLQQGLLGDSAMPPPLPGFDLQWQDFLSLSELDDLDSLVPGGLCDLDADISSPISHDVSLQDAIVSRGGDYMLRGGVRSLPSQRGPMLSLESTTSSHTDPPPGRAGLQTSPLLSLPESGPHDGGRQAGVGGFLDEAVFEQINLLDLDCLGSVDSRLLQGTDSAASASLQLDDFDSDSGLSLESSSRSPASASDSSSSDSLCEDEGGATGYSSEVESLPSKGGPYASDCSYLYVDLNENILHDHTYSTSLLSNHSSCTLAPPLKAIKQEVLSEEEEDGSRVELSRDERRVRALGLPYSAFQIVHMPVEDFLELLEGQGLSGSEVTLLRDVRRRGKNKLAAQNCRKRKLDAILGLQAEVEALTARRDALLREGEHTAKALSAATQRLHTLSRDVLGRMRDQRGRPLTPERYSLYCGANGRVAVRPRARTVSVTQTASAGGKADKRKKDKKP